MSRLLLPRLGAGNTVPFDNNYVVSKDGNPWNDGGSDTFDGTSGAQVGGSNGWGLIGGGTYTDPDGSITASKAIGRDAVDIGVYSGWAVAGIWVCEIQLGFEPVESQEFRFWCNTGYDGSHISGVVTKPFQLGGETYELKTVWSTGVAQDAWETTNETQLTVTIVPYLADQNLPGANPFQFSRGGDSVEHLVNGVSRGATMYVQWGKVSVASVQDWIVGDLVASNEFAASPHERMPLASTRPGVRCANLGRWHSPNSTLWQRPGGYDSVFHPIPHHTRNFYFGGGATISGTVKEKAAQAGAPNRPLVRRVQLFSSKTNVLVAQTWSAEDGTYRFDHLDAGQTYTVIATDHLRNYRAVIADNLTPEV